MTLESPAVSAVILAGGLARRMDGRDKGLIELANKPLVQWVLQAVAPQVQHVLINANRNLERYEKLGAPVAADLVPGHLGPLAGLLTALKTLSEEHIFMCPCDSPFVPTDMVARLRTSLQQNHADIAVAHDGVRMQPVFCLVNRSVAPSLAQFLDAGERKIDRWFAAQNTVATDFSDTPEAFTNINSEAERLALELQLST